MPLLQRDSDNKFTAKQGKGDFLDYSLDWSAELAAGDSIASSTWAGDAALTLSAAAHAGAVTTIWVQGGVANTWYAITNTVTTTQGRIEHITIRLFVSDAAPGPVQDGTAVFPSRLDAVDALRRDYLLVAAQHHLSGVTLGDDYVFEKLRAAEAYVSHALRVYLAPTVIIPDDAPQAEIDALVAAGTRYAQEAAYDYDPEFFMDERWGYIVTKQKPLISVQSITFNYPSPSSSIWTIPANWIRLDKKYGHIRLVPVNMPLTAPLNAFIMQALGGGRTVPFMIQVRYTAGIANVHAEYPDIVTAIKRLAVLNILRDSFTPQSGSISADGLSESVTLDMDKYQDAIDRTLDTVRDAIHGVRMMVV